MRITDFEKLEFDADWTRNYLDGVASVELDYNIRRMNEQFTPEQSRAIYNVILSYSNFQLAVSKKNEALAALELERYRRRTRPWWKKLFRK